MLEMGDPKSYFSGQHLTMLPLPTYPSIIIKRNESGHIIEMSGYAIECLNWVIKSTNMTYTMIDEEVPTIADVELTGQKGALSYLIEKKADVGVGTLVMSDIVAKFIDYAYPIDSSGFICLTPPPKSTTYLGGTWMPFSLEVWLVLFFSIIFIAALFYCFVRIESYNSILNATKVWGITQIYSAVDNTFRTILNQGASLSGSLLSFRILAGAWSLGCFLLVNYYGSILTSFFTAPNYEPLIKSIYDLPKNPDIKVTASAISAPVFFFEDAEEGIEKYIKDMWNNDHELLCNTTSKCLEKVLQGSSIHIDVRPAVIDYIGRDVEKSGKCRFTLADETYRNMLFGYILTKGSPYTEIFSREFLKAEAAGLRYSRKSKIQTIAERCIGHYKRESADDGYPLTLKNLGSAFILLPVGYLLALIIFCIEKLMAWKKNVGLLNRTAS